MRVLDLIHVCVCVKVAEITLLETKAEQIPDIGRMLTKLCKI